MDTGANASAGQSGKGSLRSKAERFMNSAKQTLEEHVGTAGGFAAGFAYGFRVA